MNLGVQLDKLGKKHLQIAIATTAFLTGLEFLFRNNDIVFYLFAAPLYVDLVTVKTGLLVSYVALIYNGIVALLLVSTWHKKFHFIISFGLLIAVHVLLVSLAINELSTGLGAAMKELLK